MKDKNKTEKECWYHVEFWWYSRERHKFCRATYLSIGLDEAIKDVKRVKALPFVTTEPVIKLSNIFEKYEG